MESVLLEALRRKAVDGAAVCTTRSWAQNGGSSLEAYAAIMRIEEELGTVVPVARLLGPLALDEVVRLTMVSTPGLESAAFVPDTGAAPATASQRRHWRHAQEQGSAAFLNIGRALLCARGFDPDRAEAAFRALVARHETLRNRYVLDAADRLRLEEVPDWPERVEFLRHPEAPDSSAAGERVRAAVGRTFPLDQEPAVRGGCVTIEDGSALVYFGVHHIAADGWTTDLLTRDFLALYDGQEPGPAPAFSRYAGTLEARARSGGYADDIAYWREKFARVSPDFTIARRDGAATGQRAGSARVAWNGPGEADAVHATARALGVTTYSLFLSCLLAAAHGLSGEDHVVVMSGVANRNRAEYRDIAGLFTNQIFFVGDFRAPGATRDYVRRVHADVVESLARSELPVEVVLDELGAYAAARTLAPYANILFQAAQAPIDLPTMRDSAWRGHSLSTNSIKRHCNIELTDGADGLALELDYSLALIGEHDAARLLRALRRGIAHIVRTVTAPDTDSTVAELVAEVRAAAGAPEPELTILTADYPGARAEPPLEAFVRETMPGVAQTALPVPRSLDADEIEACRQRGHDALGTAGEPAAVIAYCSAAAWARYLMDTLPAPDGAARPMLLSVNGTALTEQDWFEEFALLIRKFAPDADLREAAADRMAIPRTDDLKSRCAAAQDVLAGMRGLLETAMGERFGTPLGRVARETLEVQLSWLAYLGCCVVVGAGPAGPASSEERTLPGVRLDRGEQIAGWLRPQLEGLAPTGRGASR